MTNTSYTPDPIDISQIAEMVRAKIGWPISFGEAATIVAAVMSILADAGRLYDGDVKSEWAAIDQDRTAVLVWEWNEQLDLAELSRAIRDVSTDVVHIREVVTNSSEYAIVIANVDLSDTDAQAVYDQWHQSIIDGTDQ